jgi:N-acetyl-anhydromuramoyl-L-alanine amidase
MLNSTCSSINNYMTDLKTLTMDIQRYVGVTADGVYGPNTARAILAKLQELTVEPKTEGTSAKSDAGFPEVFKATPNVSYSTIRPEGVVLHHSYGSYVGGVEWILNDASDVSYHVLIDKDGSRTVFARDIQRAWHAGISSFNGRRGSCNGFMLGLAFTGDTTSRELTKAEIDSAVEFLLPRFKHWGWPKDLSTITTHREVSPDRKVDVDIRAEKAILKALKKALI